MQRELSAQMHDASISKSSFRIGLTHIFEHKTI